MDSTTDMGPVVDEIQFSRIMGYIAKGISEGATCAFGGKRIGTEGYYFLIKKIFHITNCFYKRYKRYDNCKRRNFWSCGLHHEI
jgi:hypothetical protein